MVKILTVSLWVHSWEKEKSLDIGASGLHSGVCTPAAEHFLGKPITQRQVSGLSMMYTHVNDFVHHRDMYFFICKLKVKLFDKN